MAEFSRLMTPALLTSLLTGKAPGSVIAKNVESYYVRSCKVNMCEDPGSIIRAQACLCQDQSDQLQFLVEPYGISIPAVELLI